MSRSSRYALLGVLSAGVFLAGLELMVTAVALPKIILDFSSNSQNPFSELRRASWIVNGYLLAYIVAMPLAGRMADVWGARRLFLVALALFTIGSLLAGRAQTINELIAGRIVQGLGGGILVPVGTAAASHLFEGHARPRALGVIGALTFLGMAAGPFVGAAILGGLNVEGALESARRGAGQRAPRAVRAVMAVGLLHQRPDRDLRPARRLGGVGRLGDAATERRHRRRRRDRSGRSPSAAGLVAVTLLGSPDVGGLDPLLVERRPWRPSPSSRRSSRSSAASAGRTRSSIRACSGA